MAVRPACERLEESAEWLGARAGETQRAYMKPREPLSGLAVAEKQGSEEKAIERATRKKREEGEDEGFWAPVGNEDFPDLEEDDAAAEPTRHRYTIRKNRNKKLQQLKNKSKNEGTRNPTRRQKHSQGTQVKIRNVRLPSINEDDRKMWQF